jgi:hypothetical protein
MAADNSLDLSLPKDSASQAMKIDKSIFMVVTNPVLLIKKQVDK